MAELTKELFQIIEDSNYHASEYRISIYGRYLFIIFEFSVFVISLANEMNGIN